MVCSFFFSTYGIYNEEAAGISLPHMCTAKKVGEGQGPFDCFSSLCFDFPHLQQSIDNVYFCSRQGPMMSSPGMSRRPGGGMPPRDSYQSHSSYHQQQQSSPHQHHQQSQQHQQQQQQHSPASQFQHSQHDELIRYIHEAWNTVSAESRDPWPDIEISQSRIVHPFPVVEDLLAVTTIVQSAFTFFCSLLSATGSVK